MQALYTPIAAPDSNMGAKADLLESRQAGKAEPLRGPEVAQLIEKAQQGDTIAFERLISVYQSKIYGFARAFTSDAQEAADLTQEALIKIYGALAGFRYQSSLLTWMLRIVKNQCLDYYKSRRQRERRRELPFEGTTEQELHAAAQNTREGDGGPEARLLVEEERRQLWAALAGIPEVYRTVVVLADMQGLSYEEIAAIVGAPVGTIKSRLNRGRDALRAVLERRRQPK